MSSNKGITLVVLVVTIILLLILSGTATYVGYDTIQKSAEQRFLNQLQEINEAVNMHSDDYENLNLTVEEHTENNITYNYVLSTESDFNKIGLYNITDTIYVNFKDGQVYSQNGINEKHTLKDFGIEYYKPTQEEKGVSNDISFNVTLEPQKYSWKYIVYSQDIVCKGEPLNGNLLYAEYKEDKNNLEWKRVEKITNGFELEIKNPGIYELKYRDDEGKESDVKEIYAYVKDGLQLYFDGEFNENYKHNEAATMWKDLSGNNNDGEYRNISINEKSANSISSDGGVIGNYSDNLKLTDMTIDYTVSGYTNSAIIYDFHQGGKYGYFSKIINNKLYIAFGLYRYTYDLELSTVNFPIEITLVCNKTNNFIKIYVNGEEKYSNNKEIDIDISPESKFGLLNNDARNEGAFKEKLNDFKIYNRCLSESEIKLNYDNNKIRYNISE